MNADPIILPIATVQPDFLSVISDVHEGLVPEDTFWLSCYKSGETSVHGKVHATLDDVDRNLIRLEGRDGVQMDLRSETAFAAACPALSLSWTRLAVPVKSYADPAVGPRRSLKIEAFDVSPDGSQFATGYHDGSVCIRSLSTPTAPPITCKPHLSTVTSLRFFPSSRVLLTAGNDFSLSVLPADPPDTPAAANDPPSPARTFRGHSRGVTCTAIVARGRNLLSGSKDGTLRLWDVPSGAQIRMLAAGGGTFSPVLGLSVGERGFYSAASGGVGSAGSIDPREVETADKLAFCALQDGSFEVFDLRTKTSTFRSPGISGERSPMQAISYSAQHGLLAAGFATGLVAVYDVRSLQTPVTSFRRNTASIENLEFLTLDASSFSLPSDNDMGRHINGDAAEVGLAIATEDGLPYIADVHPNGPRVRAELVGPDCDPVRAVRVVQNEVWTTADDGVVRRYRHR